MFRRYILALVATAAAVAGVTSAADPTARAEFISSFKWSVEDPRFGGFSGFEIAENGIDFWAISDAGTIVRGTLARVGETEKLVGVDHFTIDTLRTIQGGPVERINDDAEGLAIGQDGRIYVSFEGFHRVRSYDDIAANATGMPSHKDFKEMQNNSSLEALAIGTDGAIYTLPERSGHLARPFPVYRWRGDEWDQPFSIPRRGPFLPVGADIGPDGKFYLLERHLNGIFGFQTRIRRFTLNGAELADEEELLETATGTFGNLEGIAIWRDASGQLRATMISDDNFMAFLSTDIVEFRIPE